MTARDIFICHASGDKRVYARPLAAALARRGVSTWIDEAEVEIGDSLLDAVNAGLRLARFVVVLITERFLSRSWTRKELNGAFHREVAGRETVVLPILAIEPERWMAEFPLLADKRYMLWGNGIKEASDAIAGRFGRTPAKEWAHEHPKEYSGPVWVRCTPGEEEDQSAQLTLRWGPYIRDVEVQFRERMPVSLIHHKTGTDQITLHVSVEPLAIVTFGHGPAPDRMPNAMNIDEGWSRVAGMRVEHPKFPAGGDHPTDRDVLATLLGPEIGT